MPITDAMKNEYTKRVLRSTGVRPPQQMPRRGTPHYRMRHLCEWLACEHAYHRRDEERIHEASPSLDGRSSPPADAPARHPSLPDAPSVRVASMRACLSPTR